MSTNSKYASCSIAGDGKLYVDGSEKIEKFKIINMSAAGVNIETSAQVSEGAAVKLKVRLLGGLVDVYMDVTGKVIQRIEGSCNIEFINLLDNEREEIDELMRNTCNITE